MNHYTLCALSHADPPGCLTGARAYTLVNYYARAQVGVESYGASGSGLQLPSTALIRVLEQGSCAVPAATGQCLSSEQVPNGSGVESHCLYHSHARRGTRISPQPLSVGLDPLMVTTEQSHYMPTIVGRHPSRALL